MEATNALDAEAIAAAVERDRVALRNYVVDGFQYIRKNIKKAVVFYCMHRCRNDCKAELCFKIDASTKAIDCAKFELCNSHSCCCCVIAEHDPNEYHWDGKPESSPFFLPQDPSSSLSKHSSISSSPSKRSSTSSSPSKRSSSKILGLDEIENNENLNLNVPRHESLPKLPRHNALDVRDEMDILAKKLAVENFVMLPETIWNIMREKMNTTYGSSWCGLKREAVKHLVGRTQNEQSYGNVFSKIENTGLHSWRTQGDPFFI